MMPGYCTLRHSTTDTVETKDTSIKESEEE
jgi:hypothetical protein